MQKDFGVAPSLLSASAFLIEEFTIEPQLNRVSRNAHIAHLEPKAMQLLVFMAEQAGKVLSRELLIDHVWGGAFVTDQVLSNAISQIRQAFGDNGKEYIETIPKNGYRLTGRVMASKPEIQLLPPRTPSSAETSREAELTGSSSAVNDARPAVNPTRLRFPYLVGLGLGIVLFVAAILLTFNVGQMRERIFGRAVVSRPIESLAVLPVKNLSGDPEQELFADGMTDQLIAGLSQIKAVKVISRTSVMHYKGTSETLPQIAKKLAVDGIIEASVTRSGNRLRLTAQLIDAREDRHLWTNNYEQDMTDVLTLQSELVQAIAGEIRVQLTPQESERIRTSRRVDPEVYDTTIRAKATLEYASREGQIRQAIKLFHEAIDQDPTYAPAWAGLGQATWTLAETGYEYVSPAEVRATAIAAAEKALELDPNLPDAHEARAVIALDGEWDLEKAQQHYERALELQPGYAVAHNFYGQMIAVNLNRCDEARPHYDRALELDPLSIWNDINLLGWWMCKGRPEKAVEEGERARRRNPTLWIIPWAMADARIALGQPSQAASDYEAALELLRPERPAAVLAPLGRAYALAGRRADALRILAEMEQASQKRYISPFYLAMVQSALGRMDEAFRLLDLALEQRTPILIFCTATFPYAATLRDDPRWRPFINRLRQHVRLPQGTPDPFS